MEFFGFILDLIMDIFFDGERDSEAREAVGCVLMVILAIIFIALLFASIYALTKIL